MDNKKIMVCVTQQIQCRRLIQRAHALKRNEDDEIYVIHVVKENWRYFSEMKESDALDYLLKKQKHMMLL